MYGQELECQLRYEARTQIETRDLLSVKQVLCKSAALSSRLRCFILYFPRDSFSNNTLSHTCHSPDYSLLHNPCVRSVISISTLKQVVMK
jgi:hypothetical protein